MKQWTHDCPPTLTDTQVLDFCQKGFVLLESVVPDEINRRVYEFLDEHPENDPSCILREEWFVKQVICNPEAAGAVRSLLGSDFHLPVLMSNHRERGPYCEPGGWHMDGNFKHGYELPGLQVFYYPQDTTPEMGPTDLVPGSHHIRMKRRYMVNFENIATAFSSTAPAGSIFIACYPIWHRRGTATSTRLRNMLKYFYWRTTEPTRDWITEPDFDFATANYGSGSYAYGEKLKNDVDSAEMFYWLCGMHDQFQVLGGQSWPVFNPNRIDVPYGFPGPVAPVSEASGKRRPVQGGASGDK